MFALAEELRLRGRRVVSASTTKIWHHEAQSSPYVIFPNSDSSWQEKIREGLDRHGHVFVGRRLLESGQVEGISPRCADLLFQEPMVNDLIVEADGSAGRPVKAHAEHEPVIPSSATIVVAMMGLEAIGRFFEPNVVFRIDSFEKLTGIERGKKLIPEGLAKVFQAPEGLFRGSPEFARRVAFLNKSDLLTGDHEARELADLIIKGSHIPVDRVVIGSTLKARYSPIRRKP